jgi:D-tyrosyl-tRNA(Tyr) deacylase
MYKKSAPGRGLCVLVGIHRGDSRKELEFIVRKILNVRIFEDPAVPGKRWNKSAKELVLNIE